MSRADSMPVAEFSTVGTGTDLQERPNLQSLPTVILRGAMLHAITENQCVCAVLRALEQRRGGSVVTMNLDHLRRFVNETGYAARCRNASIVTADGMPLIWASRLQRTPLPERVTGSSMIWSLTAAAATSHKSIFLIGGEPGAAQQTAETLSSRYPGIRIVGVSSELIDLKGGRAALKRLAAQLASAAPDIVYVGLGSPKQEEVIDRLRDVVPQSWFIGVGISFSFVAGKIRRAPLWMQRSGLEWLHRLLQEPGRLGRRYLAAGLPFAAKLLYSSALLGLRKAEIRDPQPADDFSCL